MQDIEDPAIREYLQTFFADKNTIRMMNEARKEKSEAHSDALAEPIRSVQLEPAKPSQQASKKRKATGELRPPSKRQKREDGDEDAGDADKGVNWIYSSSKKYC